MTSLCHGIFMRIKMSYLSFSFCLTDLVRQSSRDNILKSSNGFPCVSRCPQTLKTCTYIFVQFHLKLRSGFKGLRCSWDECCRNLSCSFVPQRLGTSCAIVGTISHIQPPEQIFPFTSVFFSSQIYLNPMKLIAVGYQIAQISYYLLMNSSPFSFFQRSQIILKC